MQMYYSISSGIIKKNKGQPFQQDMQYEIRFIDESNLRDVINLQNIIINSLQDKEIFRRRQKNFFREHLMMEYAALGTFTDDGLIAYSFLYFPEDRENNFGVDINLTEEEMMSVVHLATVAVHPAYRGNSLQSRMQGLHLEVAHRLGYEHALCMVSPKNRPSLQNMFSQGFIIKALKIKFDGLLRYIMHKNLSCPSIIGPEEARIKSSDIEGQIGLLKQGLIGFRLLQLSDCHHISYGREMASTA